MVPNQMLEKWNQNIKFSRNSRTRVFARSIYYVNRVHMFALYTRCTWSHIGFSIGNTSFTWFLGNQASTYICNNSSANLVNCFQQSKHGKYSWSIRTLRLFNVLLWMSNLKRQGKNPSKNNCFVGQDACVIYNRSHNSYVEE
jgi:hypothetical protein